MHIVVYRLLSIQQMCKMSRKFVTIGKTTFIKVIHPTNVWKYTRFLYFNILSWPSIHWTSQQVDRYLCINIKMSMWSHTFSYIVYPHHLICWVLSPFGETLSIHSCIDWGSNFSPFSYWWSFMSPLCYLFINTVTNYFILWYW